MRLRRRFATSPDGRLDATPAAAIAGARLSLGTRSIPVVLPSRRDPRLKLAAVVLTLQVLGQTVLGFKVSIAQILVTIGFAALLETAIVLHRRRVLAWPASALLAGSAIAFILRTTGTRHGDWWSLHGIEYFLLAVVLATASKYLIRVDGCHVFNPANVALVATLLLIGPVHVFPQYLWWGPVAAPVTAALLVIVLGAIWVLRSVGKVPMALAFLLLFAGLVAVLAASGQSFVAIWHTGPVSGVRYWTDICTSPEVLIFVFFMMSDPRTSPAGVRGQIVFGAGTAVLAAALLATQTTEFGVKVAILASLTCACALRALAAASPRAGVARRLNEPAVLAAVIVALAAPIDTIALTSDTQIGYIERGLTGSHNPQ
jgi:hypothetical protein